MKSIKDYLNESKTQIKQIKGTPEKLFDFIRENVIDYGGDEVDDIFMNFVDGAKALSFESSDADYWNNYSGSDFVTQNDDVSDDVHGLEDDYDWQEEDYCSIRVDGDTLLISSQTNSYMNGDYFDLKITAYK